MDTTQQGTCFHAKQPHKSKQNPHPIYSDLLLFGIDLLVGPRRLHPSSLTSKQAMDSQEKKCTSISIMVQFRPICGENLLFAAKNSPSLSVIFLLWKVRFFYSWLFFSLLLAYHELLLPSSSHQSSCHQWPLIITSGSTLNCMTKLWAGQVGFFLIYTPIIWPGDTMQQLVISSVYFDAQITWAVLVGTQNFTCFIVGKFMRAPVIDTLCPSPFLTENITAELGGKGEMTLRQNWGHSPSLSAGFAAKSTLQRAERGHGIFLNAVEERATLFFPGLISSEAHNPIFLCTHMYAHTHLCLWGEMFRLQRFRNQTQGFLTRI